MLKAALAAVLGWAFALSLIVVPVSAQQTSPTDQSKSERQAMAVLKRMTDSVSRWTLASTWFRTMGKR
jgi:hypothetical protein